MTLLSPQHLGHMMNPSVMTGNELLPVTAAGAGRVNQQEDTTFRYLAQPDGHYRISVKAEVEKSHRSIEESSHVVMPRRWTVDDRGVLVAVRRTLPWGKPFQCSHCGELLASADTLRVHERQHTWAEGYTCGVCGREFTQLRGLKCHSRTHAGKEKTHQCNRCGKTFRRRSYLKSHEERQNCNGPFTCVSCGKIFRYSGSLFMHTRERKCSAMAM
ncbi:hypothetical protein NP493_364g04109 [Ridgeia piscesae]|uniref:C2H2-type domain-containing protein n=1 Tax=Ridgeia piscesae TaxID=27915 RepID=A0AAD9L2T6_RIDPI|nr:hypothetical protein NP493_364g04109 [Ridgeia piscesae]